MLKLIIVLSMLLSLQHQAQANPQLEEQIRECERVLDGADVAINHQAEVITSLENQNERIQKALDLEMAQSARLQGDLATWYRNPITIATASFLVGFVLGAYATKGR